MKGKVVNNLLDRKQEQKQINDLIRNNMVGRKKEDSVFDWRNQHLKPLFYKSINSYQVIKDSGNIATIRFNH